MDRKLVLLLVAAALVAGVTGCGEAPDGADHDGVRVGMVFDVGGKGDKSFNDSAYRGLLLAADELGVTFTEFEPGQDADRETGLRKLAQSGYDLIIGVGFLFSDSIRSVAADYPETKFACVDYDVRPDETLPPNLAGLTFREEEGSFLVGVLAGEFTKTDRIGFIGGMDIPLIHRFEAGFVAGAEYANPRVSTTVAYAGSTPQAFADPAKGKELALLQYGRGVDVIYHASGSTGNGVIEAARETGRYAIGVDSNQNYMAPGHVLTSMVKRVDNAVYMIVKSVVERNFEGGVREFGLEDNGIGYAVDQYNEALLTKEMITAVEEARAAIIAGEIDVPRE
ncbi:MAG: BMP family ABC transporter substrate-binding protein [Candidatus Eisenbacteria bacterium]|nr:BMP family ABC transporter substrate-binding protein [Candidatus Eisenbacteria bacterium]